jgi:glycolate oxidase
MSNSPVIDELRRIVGSANVLSDPSELMAYECDGFPIAKAVPSAVVFAMSVEQVSACVAALGRHGVQIVPRGNGTGLTGACVGFADGVVLVVNRMKRILEVDLAGRWACVEAGVRNQQLTDHVNALPGGEHLYYAPDPSSQKASTIGGNAATNAGGLHTLKYGVTVNHVLGLEMVLADGSVVRTRTGGLADGFGPDLPGVICGSEGTFGVITKVWVRLTPKPTAFRTIVGIFDSSRGACQSVADTIARGIVPAAMELLDGEMVMVVEQAFHYGFPMDAAALLLTELDGVEATLDEQMRQVEAIFRHNGARDVQCSADPKKRADLWAARKKAFGAIGRISPSYCTQDACVPRSMLPEVIETVGRIGAKYGLRIPNVFHAGDGNVHPILLFDENDPRQVRNVMHASHELLEYCVSIGGTITGEHGVGVEKLPLMSKMFDATTMAFFARLKSVFDPQERINSGKLIPSDKVRVDLLKPAAANVAGGAMWG